VLAGFLVPERRTVTTEQTATVRITPTAYGPRGYGLGVVGAF
jgi:hypothetical protein